MERSALNIAAVTAAVVAWSPLSAISATPPPVFLQYSTISGFANTITITRLPVKDGTGKITYYDVTIQLDANGAGALTPGALTQNQSPVLTSDKLRPGLYARSDQPTSELQLSGPFPTGQGGVASFTIVTKGGSPCGSPATVYTGALASNPLQPRLKNAKIDDPEYSYGVINSGTPSCGYPWEADGLIGIAQRGSQIEVASFSYGNTDYNTPDARYIYILK